MKISGFTFAKNASKLFFPIAPAIESILPIVDEFVVALGDCDADDTTREEILKINSPKIKIIRTVWDVEKYPNGMEYARQTNLAKNACSGDWLFYIQSDEVIHEKYLLTIQQQCEKHLNDQEVEGFLFKYKHFWGDYNHYKVSHALYPNEIRIIRNKKDIYSWRDAQSFRTIIDFDGVNYYQKEGTGKLKVVAIDAYVHHYGFVRPPHIMMSKNKNHNTNYRGATSTKEKFKDAGDLFDYGDMSKLTLYTETQPLVMQDWVKRFNWKEMLVNTKAKTNLKHDRLKYRLITFIEQKLMGGRQFFGFRNYILLKGK